MKKYYRIILVLILIFGGLLRLIGLDVNPAHLGNDEISIAYDSYSIRLLGKDEHGHSWPLSFESHRSYKAPLYAYFNIPFNYIFGNTEYGVRTLSAVAGIISIYLSSVIGTMIAGPNVGLVTALLMATDPKNIYVSRIGYESNLATTILLLGIIGLIKFIVNRKIYWSIFAGFFLGLSVWGYHTEWGLVPMLIISLPILYRKTILIYKWWIVVLLAILVSLPIYINFITVQRSDLNNRASSQLWFSGGEFNDYLKNSNDNFLKKTTKLITTPIYYYVEHFGLNVNFTSGAKMFNNVSPMDSGWFLLATLPMLFYGLKFGRKIFNDWWKFILLWWLLCPIVPAMTGSIASVRNLPFIVPTCLIMAVGFVEIWKKVKWRYLIVILFIINFLMFCISYFIHQPIDSTNNFQYGYKQAWELIKPNMANYDRVIVEDRFGEFGEFIGVPHLYFGYFGAFSANDMQNRFNDRGLAIGKFRFRYVDWNREIFYPKSVYIVSSINPIVRPFLDKFKLVGKVNNLDFKPQFLIYETIE